jgi:hypothetical protein
VATERLVGLCGPDEDRLGLGTDAAEQGALGVGMHATRQSPERGPDRGPVGTGIHPEHLVMALATQGCMSPEDLAAEVLPGRAVLGGEVVCGHRSALQRGGR